MNRDERHQCSINTWYLGCTWLNSSSQLMCTSIVCQCKPHGGGGGGGSFLQKGFFFAEKQVVTYFQGLYKGNSKDLRKWFLKQIFFTSLLRRSYSQFASPTFFQPLNKCYSFFVFPCKQHKRKHFPPMYFSKLCSVNDIFFLHFANGKKEN